MKISAAFLDTSFFIRLLNAHDPHHQVARGYFDRFLQQETRLYSSAIAMTEFGLKGDVATLPNEYFITLPYTARDASVAISIGKVLLAARRKGVTLDGKRNVLLNDMKMLAQAQAAGCSHIFGRDSKFGGTVDFLRTSDAPVTLQFVDIQQVDTQAFFGELF